VFLVGSAASWVRVYCLGTAEELIACRLRRKVFDSYMDKDMDFFDSARSGEFIAVLDKDVRAASQTMTDKLAAGLRSLNSSLNGSILLFTTSPTLCGVSLGIIPFVGVLAMTMSRMSRLSSERARQLGRTLCSITITTTTTH
jgi:ATP-binding cassette subfamily B protein